MTDRATNLFIFRDGSGKTSDAQLLAFEATWHWGPSAEATSRFRYQLTRTPPLAGL